jgi:hypothetical protein
VEALVHVVVEQDSSLTDAVGVGLLYPKFNPLIVTVEPPEAAKLIGLGCVSTGASYVNCLNRVPTVADTVSTTMMSFPAPPVEAPQVRVVVETHETVVHKVS